MPEEPDDQGKMVYKLKEQDKNGNYKDVEPLTVVLCGVSPTLDFSSWPFGRRKPKININI